jgi:predicted GNAT superfamily acetyltransferase
MQIRNATLADFPRILALNEESVHFLSPLNHQRLSLLHAAAPYHRVLESDGVVQAFLLVLREGAAYDSPNYLWFSRRYTQFLYVDRVVVSASLQGRGAGRLLYDDLFRYARRDARHTITCEFDTDPPNPQSARFHAAFGFREVGTQRVGANQKQVSLQAATIDGAGCS